MKIYVASRLVAISDAIHGAELAAWDKDEYSTKERADIADRMTTVMNEAEFLGLKATQITAELIYDQMDNLSCDETFTRLELLLDAFRKETDQYNLFFVQPAKQEYFLKAPLCGEDFVQKFPRANYELWESGKCLAAERYTACVFHAMRALEIALRVMESALGIIAPSPGPENTWGRIIGRIREQLDQNKNNPPLGWQHEKEFYDKASAFFQSVKMSFRDATMHVKAQYDEQSATDIFTSSCIFMRHVASELTE